MTAPMVIMLGLFGAALGFGILIALKATPPYEPRHLKGAQPAADGPTPVDLPEGAVIAPMWTKDGPWLG